MKWLAREELKKGDYRIRYAFLIFPKLIDNVWRWWEEARWIEEYHPAEWHSDSAHWSCVEWIGFNQENEQTEKAELDMVRVS